MTSTLSQSAAEHLHRRVERRQDNFDALRLLAAVVVIVSHFYALRDGSNVREPYQRLSGYCNLGKLAVYAYFVIAGYLAAHSYISRPGPARYLRNRIARVWPALALCVAVCILVVGPWLTDLPLRQYFTHRKTAQFALNAALMPRYELPGVLRQFHGDDRAAVNGSLWSVPAGAMMYVAMLVVGILGLLRRRSVAMAIMALALAAWLAYEFIGVPATSRLYKYRVWIEFLPHLAFFFFSGVLLYLWLARLNAWVLLACVAAIVGSWWTSDHRVGYALCTLALPYLVIWLGFVRVPLAGPVLNRFNRFGDASYGVYLYGYPVQQVIMRTCGERLSATMQILCAIAACLLLGLTSWHVVEKRFVSKPVAEA